MQFDYGSRRFSSHLTPDLGSFIDVLTPERISGITHFPDSSGNSGARKLSLEFVLLPYIFLVRFDRFVVLLYHPQFALESQLLRVISCSLSRFVFLIASIYFPRISLNCNLRRQRCYFRINRYFLSEYVLVMHSTKDINLLIL